MAAPSGVKHCGTDPVMTEEEFDELLLQRKWQGQRDRSPTGVVADVFQRVMQLEPPAQQLPPNKKHRAIEKVPS